MDVDGQSNSSIFIIHGNTPEDNNIVVTLCEWLKAAEFSPFTAEENLPAASPLLSGITQGILQSVGTIVLLTRNSLESPWCTFEMIVAFEKAQRENQMSVVLLLNGVNKEELPHSSVMHAAPTVEMTGDETVWKTALLNILKEKTSMPLILQSGNIAHGLVWSHFTGLLNIVLPILGRMIQNSDIYKKMWSSFPLVIYELIPDDFNLKLVQGKKTSHENITYVGTTDTEVKNRAGNVRKISLNIYKVTDHDGKEYFFVAEHPAVLSTFEEAEKMSDVPCNDTSRNHNLSLQLARFTYTMQMILDHPTLQKEWDGNKANLIRYRDEHTVVDVLLNAIKEDLGLQQKREDNRFLERLQLDVDYSYDAYICCSKYDNIEEDKLRTYLQNKGITVAEDTTDQILGNTELIEQSRWFVFLLSHESMHDDSFTVARLSILTEAINRRHTLVIPVILDENRSFRIPEVLRWVTYIQKTADDKDENYMQRLLQTIKGGAVPMHVSSYLPAGNVAYGLALGYVTNFLQLVLPGIQEAVTKLQPLRCLPRLFVLVPKSCLCKTDLEEESEDLKVIKEKDAKQENMTALLHQAADGRKYYVNVYKLIGKEEEYHFLGLYAAPINCLHQMIEKQIGGLKEDEMFQQRDEFCKIVHNFIQKQFKNLASMCRLIEFDDKQTKAGTAILNEVHRLQTDSECPSSASSNEDPSVLYSRQ